MKPWRQTMKEGWVPFMFVHMIAYPLSFLWAIAAVPILIGRLDPLKIDMRETTLNLGIYTMRVPIAVEQVLWQTLVPATLALILGNIVAVWLSIKPKERARGTVIAMGVLFFIGGVTALVAWVRLFVPRG